MGYKVIYDNGQLFIKKVFLFEIFRKIELGEWLRSKKEGRYYYFTNYTIGVERLENLLKELKQKLKEEKTIKNLNKLSL